MFDDKNWIMDIINRRDDDMIVIPLYVQIYGKRFSILELDKINKRFDTGSFKVAYGTADALFMSNSFPVERARDFDVVTVFTEYDNEKDRRVRYMVFECGDVDVDVDEENPDTLNSQIHSYYEALYNRVKKIVDEHFKALIAIDEHPIIVNDPEPEEEKEDPLESLRQEVAEYSQDDDDEEVSPFEEDPEEEDEEESSEVTLQFEDDENEDYDYSSDFDIF